jgi:Putative transposase
MHHPQVHCVVPRGGLSPDGTRWIACRPNFFLAVKPLSRLLRTLFLKRLSAAFNSGALRFFGDLGAVAEPVAELAERGLRVDYRSVWEFVHAGRADIASAGSERWRRRSSAPRRSLPMPTS